MSGVKLLAVWVQTLDSAKLSPQQFQCQPWWHSPAHTYIEMQTRDRYRLLIFQSQGATYIIDNCFEITVIFRMGHTDYCLIHLMLINDTIYLEWHIHLSINLNAHYGEMLGCHIAKQKWLFSERGWQLSSGADLCNGAAVTYWSGWEGLTRLAFLISLIIKWIFETDHHKYILKHTQWNVNVMLVLSMLDS